LETVYLAQQGTAVVFKGKVPTQETLNELIKIAQRVEGATAVATDQVVIGTAILTAGQGVAARCEFWLRKGEGWQVAAATDGRLVTSD